MTNQRKTKSKTVLKSHDKLIIIHYIVKDALAFTEEYGYGNADALSRALHLIEDLREETKFNAF
jgi:hypothetical protein